MVIEYGSNFTPGMKSASATDGIRTQGNLRWIMEIELGPDPKGMQTTNATEGMHQNLFHH